MGPCLSSPTKGMPPVCREHSLGCVRHSLVWVAWGDVQRNPICAATPSSGTLSPARVRRRADEKNETAQKPAARPSGGGLNRTSVAAPVSRREDLDAAEDPSLKVCHPLRTSR